MDEHSGISVVILAAGESRRFGSPKQLADWQGEPLLLNVISKVLLCGIKPYVALGANRPKIMHNQALSPYLDKVIQIDEWSKGLSRSIVESVVFLEKDTAGIVFLLADQPLITFEFFQRFFAQVEKSPKALLGTSYQNLGGEVGVPAYFPYAYFSELKKLKGDQGAKAVLKKMNANIICYDGGLIDIDEPEDLTRANSFTKLEKTNDSG